MVRAAREKAERGALPLPVPPAIGQVVRLVPAEQDPEAYQLLKPLRQELDALAAMAAANAATSANAAAPVSLLGSGVVGGAERLAASGGDRAAPAPAADPLGAALLMVGNLAPREDLDFVERLWLVARGTPCGTCSRWARCGSGRAVAHAPSVGPEGAVGCGGHRACTRGGERGPGSRALGGRV